MKELRRKKIGLVLTGGGAKGAYHIGCLKALRSAGITQFKAIAGTSVGAMNAVLISGDELERAELTWSEIHWRNVVSFEPARLLLAPIWVVAYLFSEFTPLRLISLLSLGGLVTGWLTPPTQAASLSSAVSAIAVGSLARVRRLTRRIMLAYVGVSTAPLAARLAEVITEDQVRLMKRSGTRIYGTLSCLRTRKNREPQWIPRYVRLDKMNREELIDNLVTGAGVPGLSDVRNAAEIVVDGGWTDNIPVAPILFDPESAVDVLIIIDTGNKSVGLSKHSATRESLKSWAEARWRTLHPEARPLSSELPEIIWVTPSESIGGFYSGTCRFTKHSARRMISLAEKDMKAALSCTPMTWKARSSAQTEAC